MDVYEEVCAAAILASVIIIVVFGFRKLLEKKRKAINDAAAAKSGHYWSPIDLVDHGVYCTQCKKNLISGYECDFCRVKVDEINCLRTLSTKFACKVNTKVLNGQQPHHWVLGNVESDDACIICGDLCGDRIGLKDFTCSWCSRVVHSSCKDKLTDIQQECDFGEMRPFIIPPSAIECRKPAGRGPRPDVIDIMNPPEFENWTPVIVVVNPRSGSGAGKPVLRRFRALLHPAQVIDVTKGSLYSSLSWIDKHEKCVLPRILIAGGDGTISLALNDIDRLVRRPPVAVLPLGTGNDLSRVLAWGKECDGVLNTTEILEDVCSAEFQYMDRWTVNIEHARRLGVRLMKNRSVSMTNYVSIGVDACVTLGMQTTRESMPKSLSSRMFNKLLFFTFGTKDVFERACKGLNKNIRLCLDDREIELPDIEGLIFLNIYSWGAGVQPWEAPDMPQSLDDGKFEVFAVSSSFHIAQLQVGMSSAYHIGQATSAELQVRRGPLPMQSDGEAWMQQPAKISITHKGKSLMLRRKPKSPGNKGFF